MAQQGFPPGRHSRSPRPGDAPYGDETQYREAPYGDEAQYRQTQYSDEASYQEAPYQETPYQETPYADERPHRGGRHSDASARRDDSPPAGYGSRAGGGLGHGRLDRGRLDRSSRPERGMRPDDGAGHDGGERPDRSRRADRQRPGREVWQQADPFASGSDTDADLPPWAGPAGYPGRPTGTLRRPVASRPRNDTDHREPEAETDAAPEPGNAADGQTRSGRRRGRAAATRLRKSRRRVYRWGGLAIAICIIAAGVVAIVTHHSPKPTPYVTSLQHGEFKAVPNTCTSVGTAVLDQYLPGSGRTTTNTQASSTNSQCSFTVDSAPNFLVMQVQAQSYQPFAAAGADGSATGNAQDNFVLTQLGLTHPPKKSPLPPAQISNVTSLGQQAFMAFQNEHVTGIVTDIVTVVIRERNVVITASLSGQESGHGFGPVPVSTLEAGAMAAAKAVLAKVMTQPTA